MKNFLFISSAFFAVVILMIALALWLGGPGTPAPIANINDPFESVDFSSMPPLKNYQGADGAKLFYREYSPQGNHKGSAVLVHGSSGSSESMHPMATALLAAGIKQARHSLLEPFACHTVCTLGGGEKTFNA